jgi:hypothetical protein
MDVVKGVGLMVGQLGVHPEALRTWIRKDLGDYYGIRGGRRADAVPVVEVPADVARSWRDCARR